MRTVLYHDFTIFSLYLLLTTN